MNLARQIEQFIEGLFRDESKAQDFIRSPESTMREAGLQNATPAQVHAVAATAAPSVAMGGGDPVVGLQRAVASHHGIAQETFAPTFHPQRVITPQEAHAEVASHTVASHTVASPATVVNDSHDFNLGLDFGDITFGNKSTAVGDGAVAIGGNNSGGIQSGKGSIHGNNNDVNNGTVKTGDGSAATVGDGNKTEGGSEKAGGGITDGNHGPVVQGTGTGTDHGTGTGTGTGHRNWHRRDGHRHRNRNWHRRDGHRHRHGRDGEGGRNGATRQPRHRYQPSCRGWPCGHRRQRG